MHQTVMQNPKLIMKNPLSCSLFCLLAILVAGCSTTKHAAKPPPEKVHERAWIGGEYKLARRSSMGFIPFAPYEEHLDAFPASLGRSNHAGIFISSLSTNAPAYQAGLREGDLVLGINHHPIKSLKAFWHCIDETRPGASVPIEAWRTRDRFECSVIVGRETFKHWGVNQKDEVVFEGERRVLINGNIAVDSSKLFDGDPSTFMSLPTPESGRSQYLQLEFSNVFTAATFKLTTTPQSSSFGGTLQGRLGSPPNGARCRRVL
jgi:hypothetical protein